MPTPKAVIGLTLVIMSTVVAAPRADAAGAAPNRPQSGFTTIHPGSAWEDVRALQYLLLAAGHRTDWRTSCDSSTVAAVRAYQTGRGLRATGLADPATLAALTVPTGYGQNSYRVFAIQTLLKKHGYRWSTAQAPGMSTRYGRSTDTDVRAFQVGHGIGSASFVGWYTWRTLFGPKTSGPIYPLMQAGTGPAQWNNCGPTAAVAILLYAGRTPAKWTWNATYRSAAVQAFRYGAEGIPNTAYDNSIGTEADTLIPALAKYGLASFNGGVNDVIAAAKAGRPSIEGGDAFKLPWATYVSGPASHFIAVLGWNGSRFIVVDPIAKPSANVPHLLTEAQLRDFAATAPGWGPNVPGNSSPPWRNSIIVK